MTRDIVIAISFVIVVLILCVVWNYFVKKMYSVKMMSASFSFDNILSDFNRFDLVGIGYDLNSDYDVAKAIKKIKPDDGLRIKIYEQD